ncbi:MAG: hydantoinase/oxoprolinase family protein [Desulfobacterales bacterium]|jgi:N-methylhydantoinase A/oxoprolinase/acetone carboxylase beta subunit
MIIGLDVGGTHTDVVLLSDAGVVESVKIPTDPDDLFNTVLSALRKITAGLDPQHIQRLVLSTTLTTNAIVQRKISEVGMLVLSGPGIDPEFFRTNRHYYTISGTIDHRGREAQPIDPEEVKRVCRIFEDEDIRHVGVVGKFSVRNPRHELSVREILGDAFDKVFMGHEFSGSLNFSRRIATTYLNAAVYAIHKAFFIAAKRSLATQGLRVPIYILKADGGTMSFEASMEIPGQTILSGPAASVMGSIAFAPEKGEALVLDIGGTTTDMALLIDRAPVLNPVGVQLGGHRTLIRSLETSSIGLGGDSVVKVSNGHLEIGPERNGPAMAYGGPVPTPTDALFVLGQAENGDTAKAKNGIASIAKLLGTSPEDTALDIFDQCCKVILREAQNMIERVNRKPVYTVHELREGYRVDPKHLLIIGGPAPYFARHIREISGFEVHLVPRWEVANAVGAALARTTCEVTLFADTQLGTATAPEENYSQKISKNYSYKDAVDTASALLKAKALKMGAVSEDLQLEVLENLQFNMVRGFNTVGKNIRVKVQVKPGLIHDYYEVAEKLSHGGVF